ncbi:hypothetical protein ACQUJO_16995 [Ralstonia pseudosolanacearum]
MVNNPSRQAVEVATVAAAIGALRLHRPVQPSPLTEENRSLGRRNAAYDLSHVKILTKLCGFAIVTIDAEDDIDGRSGRLTPADAWDDEDVAHLIYTLESSDLHNTEWCYASNQEIILCDAYTIKYNRTRRRRWEYGVKYYVKFGFAEQDNDAPTLICSLHDAKY